MPDDQVTTPAATSAAPAKKKNAVTIIIIVVAVLVVFGIVGTLVGRYIGRKAGEKIAEGIISAGTGGKVDVDTSNNSISVSGGGESISVGENSTWPSTMPNEVPRYSEGKIVSSSKVDNEDLKSWTVVVGETDQADFDSYKNSLVSAGWKSEYESSDVLQILQFVQGEYSLSAAFDSSASSVTLTVSKN